MSNSKAVNKKIDVITITTVALMAAVICILGPLSIPIGPVPISLTNLAIYLSVYVLGKNKGVASYIVYLLLGLAGLPVFSNFENGPAKLFGPTGGYLIGFIPMAYVIGIYVEKWYEKRLLGVAVMEAATWIAYLLGSFWLAYQANMTIKAALMAGVVPFLVVDFIKMAIVAFIGPEIRKRVNACGFVR